MSKMPAKKKSCFQITSVTQAQIAANSATDDTESLDDPDESQTEDVSSEIFDVSKADYEPEVCDSSSSEETLNNVGESEGQLPNVASLNGGFGVPNALPAGHQGVEGVHTTSAQQVGIVGTSQSAQVANSSSMTTIASCTSRFRVIKLDHGTGEPFRRGRWTCTEFYEKDPEGSVMSRTVDSIRHNNVTESVADRDSGLGATVGSVMAQVGMSGQGPDAGYDGLSFTSPSNPFEPQQPHSYSVAQQQIVLGSGSPESFSNMAVSVQQQVQGSSQMTVPQSLQLPVYDGVHQGSRTQQSSSMQPPQVQPWLYQPQQLPVSHHLQTQPGLISVNQPDCGQQQMPITVTQNHPGASLSVGHAVSQRPPLIQTTATGGMQVLGVEMSSISGGVSLGSTSVSSVPNLVQHPVVGLLSSIAPMAPGRVMHGLSTALQSTQNMPTVPVTIGTGPNASAAVPGSASAGLVTPNLNTSVQNQASQVPCNGTAVGMNAPGMPSSISNLAEYSRRMSDASAQLSAVQNKNVVKPLITESLQLPTPVVSSLFGISIPMDGDDDSASGGSVVAIDNKIEQAMDLVKSHLMYAVREEVEVLKEQIKELYERNSLLERENAVLKSLANNEQLSSQSISNPTNTPSQLESNLVQPPPPLPHTPPFLQLDVNKTIDSLPQQLQPKVTSA